MPGSPHGVARERSPTELARGPAPSTPDRNRTGPRRGQAPPTEVAPGRGPGAGATRPRPESQG
eukprot:9584267-Alexandrium_andersonii.AAC.1